MTRRRRDFLSVLPLYLALATAIGYVDRHVRTHPDHAYTTYMPAVIAGDEAPPGRYRILAPLVYEKLVQLTRLPSDEAWLVFRWLCLLAAFIAGDFLYRTWFAPGVALAGNALVASVLPLTFTNAYGHPDDFMELFLFTLGAAAIARGSNKTLLAVLLVASFNRETAFLLVLLFAGTEALTAARLRWIAAAGVVWAIVYAGLRWRLGFVAYDPFEFQNNMWRLFQWPAFAADRDLYSRLYPWFFVILLAGPAFVIARTWAKQPRFARVSAGLVAPVFVGIGVTFSSVIEPRIFTPLLPLLVIGVLFSVFSPEAAPRSVCVPELRANG